MSVVELPRPDDLRFDEAEHRYFVGQRELPSVTTVLSRLYDLSAIPRDVLEHKRQIGMAVHAATDLLDNNRLDLASLDPQIVGYVDAWRAFKADHGWTVLASEWRGYHPTLWYAGTLDKVMQKPDSVRVLLDAKTTVDMHPAIGPQTDAYKAIWNRWNPSLRVTQRCGLQLRPDGTYRLHPYISSDDSIVFAAELTSLNWRKRHGIV